MNNNVEELNLEALEGVTGGVKKHVDTGTDQNAAIRKSPGTGRIIASLPNGTVVNTIGSPVYDEATGRNWIQVQFTDAHGAPKTGWIAASIVGMKR